MSRIIGPAPMNRGRQASHAAGIMTSGLAACLMTVATAALLAAPAVAGDPAAQSAAARAILDGWHVEAPEPGARLLHVIAWRTNDRGGPAAQRERLDRIMTHIQEFFRREMERHGLGPRSIRLDRDETVMIFTNLAEWDPERFTFRHDSPYYAGGDRRGGTAWQLDSPELDVRNLPLREPIVQDAQYGRISLGKHNSIFIGGIAHELGHALGLPHCQARPDEEDRGTALMGSGNRTYGDELRGEGRGTFLTLAHALRLASHPQFSGSVRGLDEPARGVFSDLDVAPIADGRGFRLRGRVDGTPPVYAVIGYLDPEGSGDYDARTVTAVPASDGRFTIDCTALVPGKPAEMRLVACHANGDTTRRFSSSGGLAVSSSAGVAGWPYTVAADGTVDVGTMRIAFELAPFLDVLAESGVEAARAIPLAEGPAAAFAAAVLAGRSPHRDALTIDPARPPIGITALPLSRARPVEARVGWLEPAYDQIPRHDAVIESAGRLYETGIYAHAPAVHRYELDGGWTRLHGACGLVTQPGGSVVFVIMADGREVFRSPRLVPGKTVNYDVGLTGVRHLELRTEDAGDGQAADWGVWLAPELAR